jgi:hypothetical protein
MTAAAQNQAPSGNGGTTFAAWDAFAGQLRSLGDQLVEHLPERLRDDPQVRQEAGRVLLEAVAAETIQAISADPDYPVFLPLPTSPLIRLSPTRTLLTRRPPSPPGDSIGCGAS